MLLMEFFFHRFGVALTGHKLKREIKKKLHRGQSAGEKHRLLLLGVWRKHIVEISKWSQMIIAWQYIFIPQTKSSPGE